MIRIVYAQLNPTVGDLAANANAIIAELLGAQQHGAHVLVVPELALTGYPPRDLLEHPHFLRDIRTTLRQLVQHVTGPTALLLGTPVHAHGDPLPEESSLDDHAPHRIANGAVLIQQQQIIACHRKWLLPTYDVFDEHRYFVPGTDATVVTLHGIRIGISVCEDIWNDKAYWQHHARYDQDPVAEQVAAGVDLLINISASPYDLHKPAERCRMLQSVALRHQRPIVYVNQVGGNDSLLFDGRSMVIAADGTITHELPAFCEARGMVQVAGDGQVNHVSIHATGPSHTHANTPQEAHDAQHDDDLLHALCMGIRDYTRKCGFAQVVLGLSGGIDSALTAALAVEALGAQHVLGVAMPSPYSSQGSIDDAMALAARLGIRCDVVPIHGLFAEYLHALAPAFAGLSTDVTEENLQARIRGALLMAYANKFGALLLTTGNKSEVAVGYCTLYGDMCGGLAVISDLYKTQVYGLARHINARAARRHGAGASLPPIPENSLTKAPSAELRPDQCDQQSLPPYAILDDVLSHYIDGHQDPRSIIAQGHDAELVRRIITMVDRAEYKRRQMAPGLRISRKAFGEGRRLPVAQRYIPSIP